jgi:hypothetical protein
MNTALENSRNETTSTQRSTYYAGLDSFLDMVRNAPEIVVDDRLTVRVLSDPYTGEQVVRNYGGTHFCLRLPKEVPFASIGDIVRTVLAEKEKAYQRGKNEERTRTVANFFSTAAH